MKLTMTNHSWVQWVRTRLQSSGGDWLVLLLLFGLALFLRTYALDTMPPGLFNDAAANGLDARAILAGDHSIFFERNSGREPLFIYLQAALMMLIGQTPLALRLTAALLGAATVPATYWLVRELFAESDQPARSLAFWSALLLAMSYWPMAINRLAFRVNLLPLLAALTFALFWRSWHRLFRAQRLPWLSLCATGLALGFSLYTYTAARFLPLVLLVVFAATWQRANQSVPTRRRFVLAIFIIVGCSLLAFAPLAFYFVQHPHQFIQRAATVSVFSQADSFIAGLRGLGTNSLETLGLFGFVPDPNVRHNPALRPALSWLVSGWLVLGIVVAIRRVRSLPYLFLLVWVFFLALPAMMTHEGNPHSLRAFGLIPVVYILPIIGLLATGSWLTRSRFHYLALWLPLPFVLFTAVTDISDYFSAWQHQTRFESAFFTHYVALGERIAAQSTGDEQWIFTLSPNHFPPETELYTIDFLYGRQMQTVSVITDPATASAKLAARLNHHESAYLLRPQPDLLFPDAVHTLGDSKNLIKFLLDKYALKIESRDATLVGMPYLVYALPEQATYTVSGPLAATNDSFDHQMKLIGYDYGRVVAEAPTVADGSDPRDLLIGDVSATRVPSGGALWVVLRWEAENAVESELKSALYLIDEAGHRVAQSDELLVGDQYPIERRWAVGEQSNSYHILPTLPAIPPGFYTLMVRLYEDITLRQYPAIDGTATGGDLRLGTVEVVRATIPPLVAPDQLAGTPAEIEETLRLVGYDAPPAETAPGDSVTVTAYWQALQPPNEEYAAQLQLHTTDGQLVATTVGEEPIGGSYRTSQWDAQEIVRAWHTVTVPATLENGAYQLSLLVSDATRPFGEIAMGTLTVAGRPHRFEPLPFQLPATASFGDSVRLLGVADLAAPPAQPGAHYQMCLVWQPLRSTATSLTRFVHLLNEAGQVVAQQDTLPCAGHCPSTSWVAGEYLCDEVQLTLPADLPHGDFRLAVGWYESESLISLPTFNETGSRQQDDRFLLPTTVQVGE